MARVAIRPHPRDLDLNRDVYELLQADLAAAGHDVWLEQGEAIQVRGSSYQGPVLVGAIILWLAMPIARELRDQLVEEIARAIHTRLTGRLRPKATRQVVIYDGDGEILSLVNVEADASDE